MEVNKVKNALGLCRRAGRLSMGFDAVCGAIKGKTAQLVLFACDLSQKTEKECRYAAQRDPVTMIVLPFDMQTLAEAIGVTRPVGVVAVTDSGLAKMVRQACRSEEEE